MLSKYLKSNLRIDSLVRLITKRKVKKEEQAKGSEIEWIEK